ncbi:DNA repair protein RecN [Gammaproteobacteria bacterium]|nr:DNA repair protein RecN [Gammaproteobacteria bacterium]
MLRTLSIRNILLIESLDLNFDSGLGVLTGETGSGKSILLDALSLAIGVRADIDLIRDGEDQSTITAEFEIQDISRINSILSQHGMSVKNNIILRRVISSDGRSRAFIDDQAVSVTLLRQIGFLLVEVHGQLEAHGLLDTSTHRTLVDAYGDYGDLLSSVSSAFKTWRAATINYETANKNVEKLNREQEFLQHAVNELEALDPKPNEELELASKRRFLMSAEKSIEGLQEIFKEFNQENGFETMLGSIIQRVKKIADTEGNQFDNALASLERALLETNEGIRELEQISTIINLDPQELEKIEERLFRLRGLARKYNVEVEKLPNQLLEMSEQLDFLRGDRSNLEVLFDEAGRAKVTYKLLADRLSQERKLAIAKLDSAVTSELSPLKLEAATFHTRSAILGEGEWSEFGTEALSFEVKTNPNTAAGPIQKVASGGELARITLALKAVLADAYSIPTIIFDEVDAGIGGAAAAAVGDRLNALSTNSQVLVVTHSPQVAARGAKHFLITKNMELNENITIVEELHGNERVEEIARMLSGETVTAEARAAAISLLDAGHQSDFV